MTIHDLSGAALLDMLTEHRARLAKLLAEAAEVRKAVLELDAEVRRRLAHAERTGTVPR